MKTIEDNKKEIKNALTHFIGKLIHFKDKNFDENIDNAGSIFRGTHVTDNDEGVLLWDNEYRYVTLQYALENSIKDCSKNEPNNPYNDIVENNKLIAEFMCNGKEYEIDINTKTLKAYHSSWDWLMPVANEIIKSRDEQNADWDLTDLKYALSTTNIDLVYKAVVEFIKHTNLNQQ